MKNSIVLLVYIFNAFAIKAQTTISWERLYGGGGIDLPSVVQQTLDGGYIVAGLTASTNGDVTESFGNDDIWIVKLDVFGDMQWQKSLGGSQSDRATSIQQTHDGGYIVSGRTNSNDGHVTGYHGDGDFWVVKLDPMGGIQWQRAFGGSGTEYAGTVAQTSDGGYIAISSTNSEDGDVSLNHGFDDVWVIKLSSTGEIQWEKTLGGSSADYLYCADIQETTDNGYILATGTYSNDGDVSGNHGNGDFWVVKLSETGAIQWQRALGGSGSDFDNFVYIQQTNEGGYVFSGSTYSTNGDVSGNHGERDLWVVKLSNEGIVQWQNTLGGSASEKSGPAFQTPDGGYVLACETLSNNFDVSANHGKIDLWLLKLSDNGEIQWQKALGGTKDESGGRIALASDGGYILTCASASADGDITAIPEGHDFWVVKLSLESVAALEIQPIHTLEIFPNPATNHVFLKTPLDEGAMSVKITDANGRLVLQQILPNGIGLDISTLSNGIYSLIAAAPSGKIFSNKLNIVR